MIRVQVLHNHDSAGLILAQLTCRSVTCPRAPAAGCQILSRLKLNASYPQILQRLDRQSRGIRKVTRTFRT